MTLSDFCQVYVPANVHKVIFFSTSPLAFLPQNHGFLFGIVSDQVIFGRSIGWGAPLEDWDVHPLRRVTNLDVPLEVRINAQDQWVISPTCKWGYSVGL